MKFVPMLLLTLYAPFVIANDCEVFMTKGIYDIWHTKNEEAATLAYAESFCMQNFLTEADSSSITGALGIVYESVPIKAGFDSSKQEYKDWQDSFCKSVNMDQSVFSSLNTHRKTINPKVIEAVDTCLNAPGVHAWVEFGGRTDKITIAAKFNGLDHRTPSAKITIQSSDNLKCRPKKIDVRDRSTKRLLCTRNDRDAATILLNSDTPMHGADKLNIPAVYTPKPTVGEACETYRDGRKDSVACNSKTEKGFYWRVGRKLAHYSTLGTKAEGSTPTCNEQNVNSVAKTSRFPITQPEFQEVRQTYENLSDEGTAPGCNYTGNSNQFDSQDRSFICGIFEAVCLKQP